MEDTDRQTISLAVSKQIWSHERERESMNMNTFIVTIIITTVMVISTKHIT